MLTRAQTPAISEDLLNKLLVALSPTNFNDSSTLFHMGYHRAQEDFRAVLEFRLNAGPLPEAVMPVAKKAWWRW